jgi:hypothetical protein
MWKLGLRPGKRMISRGGGVVIHRDVRRKGVTGETLGDTRNTFSWKWYEIYSTSIGRDKRGYLKMIRCSTIDKSTVYLFDPFCTLFNITQLTQGYTDRLTSSLEIYTIMCSAAFFPDESFPPPLRRSICNEFVCVEEGGS